MFLLTIPRLKKSEKPENTVIARMKKTDFYFFYIIFIHNFLNDFSKKCWVTALVRSMTFIVGLNQF